MRSYVCRLSIALLVYAIMALVPVASPNFFESAAGYVLTGTFISENVVVIVAIHNYVKMEALCS